MLKRLAEGTMIGVGIVLVVAVAFAIAWAGDVFTVDKDGTLKFAVNDQGKITVGATESYVNLVIQNNAAAANNKVDITADVLTVEGIRLENVNISADLTLSGAGGLDTGSEASGTWYYVWVLTNNDGIQRNGLFSTSSTSPTMPTGFTKKRRIGAVRNDGSSNFLQFVQEGNRCNYLNGNFNNRVLSDGTSLSWATVNGSAYVPTTSRRAIVRNFLAVSHGTAGTMIASQLRKTGSNAANGQCTASLISQVNGLLIRATAIDAIDLNATQQFDYFLNTAVTSGGIYIDVTGYYDRI